VFRKRIQEPAPIILPHPNATIQPHSFLAYPVAALNPVQQWLYQKAFEEAQAVARPSILERDLLGVWN
jgi:hypothetical protein